MSGFDAYLQLHLRTCVLHGKAEQAQQHPGTVHGCAGIHGVAWDLAVCRVVVSFAWACWDGVGYDFIVFALLLAVVIRCVGRCDGSFVPNAPHMCRSISQPAY